MLVLLIEMGMDTLLEAHCITNTFLQVLGLEILAGVLHCGYFTSR
jgi:hypothetical protein